MKPNADRVSAALAVALVILVLSCPLRAAPVVGEKFNLRQPDGSFVAVRIWGDEFYQVVESLDGYTLIRDPKTGIICYARLAPDGNDLLSAGIPATDSISGTLTLQQHLRINPAAVRAKVAAARARFAEGDRQALLAVGAGAAVPLAAPPCTGNVQAICLIVDFSDEMATIPRDNVDDYCNLVGYTGYSNNGSVRDYFYEVSDGNLTYTNYVPPAYYRAQNPKTYYEDPAIPYGTRAKELIIEALEDLDAGGFDFSQYDANGDGLVDGINCYYAGSTNNAWAEGLWPHSWSVSFSADDVSTYRYQITDMGSQLDLGTFCHENGHMICYWPDLYDYDYDSNGVGRFCLMCYGGFAKNPVEPCAYMKYVAGWATATLLTTPQFGLSAATGVNQMYKFEHPTLSNEYYLVENRQSTGRDDGLPDSGLAIWHVDTYGNNDNQQMTPESHYLVTLVQADGDWDLEHDSNYGDSTDLWKAPTLTQCDPDTDPNTDWWDGSESDLGIYEISGPGATMTFTFGISRLILSTAAIERTIYLGDALTDDSFTVANSATTTINYTISDDADWFSVAPDTGSSSGEADTIDVIYDDDLIGNLPKGQHVATITVSSPDATNSPQTIAVTLTVETVDPDFDGDADVDMEDFGHLQACYSGPGAVQQDPDCFDARLDGDADVDAGDLAIFKDCMTSANVAAPRDCAD